MASSMAEGFVSSPPTDAAAVDFVVSALLASVGVRSFEAAFSRLIAPTSGNAVAVSRRSRPHGDRENVDKSLLSGRPC